MAAFAEVALTAAFVLARFDDLSAGAVVGAVGIEAGVFLGLGCVHERSPYPS